MHRDDHQLLAHRNAYNYPRVYLEALYGGPMSSRGIALPLPANPAQVAAMSQADWEGRHRALLRSNNPSDALLGLASTVYWGFYAGATGRTFQMRALARARWFRDGRPPGSRAPVLLQVHAVLQEVARLLDAGNVSQALRTLCVIPEFGQISFASKVLAAMAPERCGVYDRIVADVLATGRLPWAPYVAAANSGGISAPKSDAYARWCELCAHRARQMNLYDVSVSGWSHDVVKREWRAVDVERAFFNCRLLSVLSGPIHS